MQWMWKQWLHLPETNGQSSPGALQSAQQSSNWFLQMPQSSCFTVHFQAATLRKLLILNSMTGFNRGPSEWRNCQLESKAVGFVLVWRAASVERTSALPAAAGAASWSQWALARRQTKAAARGPAFVRAGKVGRREWPACGGPAAANVEERER